MRLRAKSIPILSMVLLLFAACGGGATPTPEAVGDGSRLYMGSGCAICHGDQGQGRSGPSILHHSEAQVLKQVREPSGVMPAFDASRLSDAELAAIAKFVAELEGADGHDEPDHGAEHSH